MLKGFEENEKDGKKKMCEDAEESRCIVGEMSINTNSQTDEYQKSEVDELYLFRCSWCVSVSLSENT